MAKTICPICKKEFSYINSRHAKKHNVTLEDLKKLDSSIRTSPTQGMKFSEETRNKMRIKSDKYYESLRKQDRSGSNNSFYGKKHSEESKSKMGRDITGKNNPFYGKKHSEASRLKMSKTRSELISIGKLHPWHHNNGKYTSLKSGKVESYDSKLELFRMIQMDNDINIVSWTKKHNIIISYIDIDEIECNYVPDFLVEYSNGSIYIEEVKGWDVKSELKLKGLVKYCELNGRF